MTEMPNRCSEPSSKDLRGDSGISQLSHDVRDEATEMLRNPEKMPMTIYSCVNLNLVDESEEVSYASICPDVQNLMPGSGCIGSRGVPVQEDTWDPGTC